MIYPQKENCCGCGICAESCPVQAIKMEPDENGFFYPIANRSICIKCSKCEKVCAFNSLDNATEPLEYYVARHKSDSVCRESTSGGMYTAITDVFLNQGNVVYSPAFDQRMYLQHMRICNAAERDISRGSKYVQSDLYHSLSSILADLNESKKVVFFGTPCQVAAIKSFVPKRLHANLFTVDVICNGVGSPMFWEKHKNEIEGKYKGRMNNYVFRPKKQGYLTQTEVAIFDKIGEREIVSDYFRYNVIYYSRLIMRPCCANCKFCSYKRVSDITISDYSKEERKDLPFDTSDGVSSLMINTEKGRNLLSLFEESIQYVSVSPNCIAQIRLEQCEGLNPKHDEFLRICREKGIESALNSYFGIFKRIKIKLKEIYNRMVL